MKAIRDIFSSMSPDEGQLIRMAENIERKSAPPRNAYTHRAGFRRTAAFAAAAALLIAAAVSAAAYAGPEIGTAVRTFFSREELISESGGLIERSVTEEGITLSVDGAVKDGDTTYLLCTMTNHEEDFAGQIFTAEWITLDRKPSSSDSGKNQNLHIRKDQRGIAGIYAGEVLKVLRGDEGNTFSFILTYKIDLPEGEYSLTLSEPMLATAEMDGSISRHDLAGELSVTFPLGQLSDVKATLDLTPKTRIPMDCGESLTLEKVHISPVEIRVMISDYGAKDVPAPNHPDILISPLDWICCFYGLKETGLITREEWTKVNEHSWSFSVTFKDGTTRLDSANSYGSYPVKDNEEGWRGMNYYFRFDSPAFPEDIVKISLVRGPENAEEIIIWTP